MKKLFENTDTLKDVRVKGLVWPSKRFNAESLVKKNFGLSLMQVLAKAEHGTEGMAYDELETEAQGVKVIVKAVEDFEGADGTGKNTRALISIIKNESYYDDCPAFATSGDMIIHYFFRKPEAPQGEAQ